MNGDQELLAVFKAEAEEQIDQLGELIVGPPEKWSIDRLFHLSHNVKGAARLVGVNGVRDAAHALEDLFSAIRDGLDLSDDLVALIREGSVLLETSFAAMGGDIPGVEQYRAKASRHLEPKQAVVEESEFAGDPAMLILFQAESNDLVEDLVRLVGNPPDRWQIDKLVRLCADIRCSATTAGVGSIRETAEALEHLFSVIHAGRNLGESEAVLARDGADLLERAMQALNKGQTVDTASFLHKIDESTRPTSEPKTTATVFRGAAEPTPVPSTEIHDETLRVAVGKLDSLMGLTSELVAEAHLTEERSELANRLALRIAAMLRRHPELRDDHEGKEVARLSKQLHQRLADGSTRASRTSEELQDAVRMLRMIRIDSISSPFKRTMRDACRTTGIQAQLSIEGGETEVDRAVLENLRDPLIHLIRNAVAHGIEPAAERLEKGKDEIGTVTLAARSAGTRVEIIVRDDGRGIDPETIRKQAPSHGIALEELALLDDAACLDLLFRPGFTTVGDITDLAGRGVGLDVVRSNVSNFGGTVSVTSEKGRGARFTLSVPLTRLTTRGIIIRLDNQRYAATIGDVKRTVRVEKEHIITVDGVDVIRVDHNLVPVGHLGALFGLPVSGADNLPALILAAGDLRRAVMVDEVIGQTEFIVQPLSWNLEGAHGLAGTAVMDGGEVVLVLDGGQLVHAGGRVSGASGKTETPSAQKFSLLVVDDSVTSRTLVRNILTSAGYDVTTAVDGQEALSLLESTEVDLVVTDVEMPGINGFDLTKKIRSTLETKKLPIILVTSLGSTEHKIKGADAGADAYIVKGEFDQEVLLRAISRLL